MAAAGGVVVTQEFHPAYGNMIEIDHGNDLITRYAHASQVFVKKGDLIKRGKKIAKKEHELARQLLAPVTVCTIDHLLIALTLTREDHHTIVFNLANSCVVIDEADFYDEFTQANILVLLEALKI